MFRLLNILIIIFSMLFYSCVEEFNPDIQEYDNVIIIDGLVTNEQRPYFVKISRTYSFEEKEGTLESDAVVLVEDDLGNIYQFDETEDGIYASDPKEFIGETGRKYKLYIQTKNDEEYESDFEEIRNVPVIDSVYWEYNKYNTSDVNKQVTGIQIKLDSHNPENNTRYYAYEWSETWLIRTPFFGNDTPSLCWASDSSDNIIVISTDHLEFDVVSGFKLPFVTGKSNRLYLNYSILVKQYSLTQEAYSFWVNLKKTNEDMGSLFDPTPTAIEGNIYNINQPDKPVLGYFQVSSVTEKRMFIEGYKLPPSLEVVSGYEYCRSQSIIASDEVPGILDSLGWVIVRVDDLNGFIVYTISNSMACADCRYNGTEKKPKFWIN